ncbi:P2Y purinoceptor 14 [Denticeps clupeoides]|uniref:P2Y purinoceptor 14 n=1 Tax=Denticeps clupeoides TaxID=299321 RepID=UPI0010A50CAD|nr:P2Y purinoceptor 14-like [Denticeps clupeoides]
MEISDPGISATPAATLNASKVSNGSECARSRDEASPFFAIAYALVFLVSVALNGVALRAYFCRPRRHSSSVTVFLRNLAVADLFLSLCLPLRIANYASSVPVVRHVYCSCGASAFYLNMYASILFMEYIAANRYLKIVRPLETNPLQAIHSARVTSGVTWAFLVAAALTYMVILQSTGVPQYEGDSVGCEALHSDQAKKLYQAIHLISAGIFSFVLVSLVLFYCSIARRLSQAQRVRPEKRGCGKLARSKRNMLVLVCVFCVCFVPYHLVRLPYAFLKGQLGCYSWAGSFYTAKEVTVLLSAFNACLDPLIYFFFSKAFRAQLGLRGSQSPTTSLATTEARRRESTF